MNVMADTAVVIPARNEQERIGVCLMALAGQRAKSSTIILVVNNTTDDTIGVARQVAHSHEIDLVVIHCLPTPEQGVGMARQIGFKHALRILPNLQYLLTTDADCITAPDWIARSIEHLKTADAVCGKIELIEDEADLLDGMDRDLAANEGVYRRLVEQVYVRHGIGCADIQRTHSEAAGASLGFRRAAYLAVGGFKPIACGEDRQIVRDLRSAGYRVRQVDDVSVRASCRLDGRAIGGMSDALSARITQEDYLIDDCLPTARSLERSVANKTLGVWPPLVSNVDRLHVSALPQNIAKLEKFLNLQRSLETLVASASAQLVPLVTQRKKLPITGPTDTIAGLETQSCLVRSDEASVPLQTKPSEMAD